MDELSFDGRPAGGCPTLVAAAALSRDGEVFISQRRQGKPGAGFWEFPGGRLEPTECPEEPVYRELKEELGVIVGSARPVTFATDSHARIVLLLFLCEVWEGEPTGREGQSISWVPLHELEQQEMLGLDEELISPLRAALTRS